MHFMQREQADVIHPPRCTACRFVFEPNAARKVECLAEVKAMRGR